MANDEMVAAKQIQNELRNLKILGIVVLVLGVFLVAGMVYSDLVVTSKAKLAGIRQTIANVKETYGEEDAVVGALDKVREAYTNDFLGMKRYVIYTLPIGLILVFLAYWCYRTSKVFESMFYTED